MIPKYMLNIAYYGCQCMTSNNGQPHAERNFLIRQNDILFLLPFEPY